MVSFSQIILLFLCCNLVHTAQPYFPSQIVFTILENTLLYAIDEDNQRAAMFNEADRGFVFEHIPYALPDSPQDKYYTQLLTNTLHSDCLYETYWEYGSAPINYFPDHWQNGKSFKIKSYFEMLNEMIHSTNSSESEDYWYSNKTCETTDQHTYPCEEIYFKKNTDIPLRTTQVRRLGRNIVQVPIEYNVISIGKIDEKYFNSFNKNWSIACQDASLGLYADPQTSKISVGQSGTVQIWLRSPPHRINGTDTVTIQWNPTECIDCLTWTPKELSFNIENFQEQQNITFTRTKAGSRTALYPIFHGGGYDLVPTVFYRLFVE